MLDATISITCKYCGVTIRAKEIVFGLSREAHALNCPIYELKQIQDKVEESANED